MRGDWHGRESWDLFFLRLRRYDVWVPNANMWWVSTTISRAFLSVPPRSGSTTCSKAHRWLLPHGFLSRYVFRSGKCVQRGMRGRADTTWVRLLMDSGMAAPIDGPFAHWTAHLAPICGGGRHGGGNKHVARICVDPEARVGGACGWAGGKAATDWLTTDVVAWVRLPLIPQRLRLLSTALTIQSGVCCRCGRSRRSAGFSGRCFLWVQPRATRL